LHISPGQHLNKDIDPFLKGVHLASFLMHFGGGGNTFLMHTFLPAPAPTILVRAIEIQVNPEQQSFSLSPPHSSSKSPQAVLVGSNVVLNSTMVGSNEIVGEFDGISIGASVGFEIGELDGVSVGASVGFEVIGGGGLVKGIVGGRVRGTVGRLVLTKGGPVGLGPFSH